MALAPVLPWRKASGELLRTRLQTPPAFATIVLVACVAGGIRGAQALFVFFLGAFAAGAAFRQLGLAMRAARARKQSPLRALVGRANGGMIVHFGVILIAIAIAASRTYGSSGEVTLAAGEKGLFKGHTIELVAVRKTYIGTGDERRLKKILADVRVDGGRIDTPALTSYSSAGSFVGTPSVHTGLLRDVYLTLVQQPQTAGGRAVIGVYIQPMTVWLWVGGLIMAFGTLLAAVPGRRRRPTNPTSTLDAGTQDHERLSGQPPARRMVLRTPRPAVGTR